MSLIGPTWKRGSDDLREAFLISHPHNCRVAERGMGREESRKKLAPSCLYANGEMQVLLIPQGGYLGLLQVSELCGRAALT